MNFSDS